MLAASLSSFHQAEAVAKRNVRFLQAGKKGLKSYMTPHVHWVTLNQRTPRPSVSHCLQYMGCNYVLDADLYIRSTDGTSFFLRLQKMERGCFEEDETHMGTCCFVRDLTGQLTPE